jgi:hypothetical protein
LRQSDFRGEQLREPLSSRRGHSRAAVQSGGTLVGWLGLEGQSIGEASYRAARSIIYACTRPAFTAINSSVGQKERRIRSILVTKHPKLPTRIGPTPQGVNRFLVNLNSRSTLPRGVIVASFLSFFETCSGVGRLFSAVASFTFSFTYSPRAFRYRWSSGLQAAWDVSAVRRDAAVVETKLKASEERNWLSTQSDVPAPLEHRDVEDWKLTGVPRIAICGALLALAEAAAALLTVSKIWSQSNWRFSACIVSTTLRGIGGLIDESQKRDKQRDRLSVASAEDDAIEATSGTFAGGARLSSHHPSSTSRFEARTKGRLAHLDRMQRRHRRRPRACRKAFGIY